MAAVTGRRVLMPGGVVAAWTCTVFRAGGATDAVVDRFYHGTIGPYGPLERDHVQNRYRTIPFAREAIDPLAFTLPSL